MHQATVVPKSPAGREGWVTTSSGLTTTAPPGANVPAGWKTARESKQLVPRKPSRRKQTKGGADGVLRPLSLILCLLVFALALPVVSPVWLSDANRFLVPSIQSAARSVGVTSSHVKSPALFPSGDAVSPALTTLCIVAAGHMVASWSQFEARLTQAALVLLLGTASIVVAAWIHSQAELPTQIATSVAMAGGCVMTGSLLYTEVTATMLVMYELVALPIGDDPDEADAELLSRPWQSIKAWGSFLCPACLVAVNLLQIALTPLDQGSSWTLVLKIVAFVAYLATFMLHAFVTDVAAIVRIARQRQSAGSACSSCLSLASCRRPGVFKETTLGSRAARVLIVAMALAVQWAAPTFTVFMAPTSACESAWVSANGSAWPTGLEHTAAGRATIQASADLNLQLHWSVAYSTVASVVLYLVASQSFISSRRARDASAAASRLRGALRYISHEARSPLGGAILSLTLMDDAIDDGDTPASKALVGDLHVSLEAAKRHLDDLLLFEKVTGSGEDSGAWGWDGFGRSTLSRQTRAFRGACRAEGIGLSITSASGRLNVGATLEGWRQELVGVPAATPTSADAARPSAEARQRSNPPPVDTGGGMLGTTPARAEELAAVAGQNSSDGATLLSGAIPENLDGDGAVAWQVYANWQRLDAVVQNAVSNSVKHAPGQAQGRISVAISTASPRLMVGARPRRMPEGQHAGKPPAGGVSTAAAPGSAVAGAAAAAARAANAPAAATARSPTNHARVVPNTEDPIQGGRAKSHLYQPFVKDSPAAPARPGSLPVDPPVTTSADVSTRPTSASAANAIADKPLAGPQADALAGGIVLAETTAASFKPVNQESSQKAPGAPASAVPRRGRRGSLIPRSAAAAAGLEQRVLVIEVLDNGRGIPADMLLPGKLFRPFQQLRMGDSALRMTSSGLGLSIVKSVVVDQMGGEVGLASREGEGTLFFAHIPVWARRPTTACDPEEATVVIAAGAAVTAERSSSSAAAGTTMGFASAASISVPGRTTVAWTDLSGSSRTPLAAVNEHSRSAPDMTEGLRTDAAQLAQLATVSEALARPGTPGADSGAGSGPADGVISTTSRRSKADRAARRARRKQQRTGGADRAVVTAVVPRLRAFVVDDEKVNRTLMARVIRRWGAEVSEMSDGSELVSAMQRIADAGGDAPEWPMFVTLDMQMPGVDGCGALGELRQLEGRLESSGRLAAAAGLRAVAVVGVTGHAMSDDRDRMLSLGACRVLTKPVEPVFVAEAVRDYVPGARLPERAFKSLRH